MSPQRIQRQRTKGWRMPEGAVYVGRPSVFGNPFSQMNPHGYGRHGSDTEKRALLVRRFYAEMVSGRDHRFARMATRIGELRGHDLACWCPLDQPCHADVLLELANR